MEFIVVICKLKAKNINNNITKGICQPNKIDNLIT